MLKDQFKNNLKRRSHDERENLWRSLKIVQDPLYRRLMSRVDYDLVLEIMRAEFENLNLNVDLKNSDENSNRLVGIYERFQSILHHLNNEKKDAIENDLTYAVNNVMCHFYYYFLDANGHKWPRISHPDRPIVTTYFFFPFDDTDATAEEAIAYDESTTGRGIYVQAHNGWVMGYDPLKNFATQGSTVYFK